jgi:hypothetical protein
MKRYLAMFSRGALRGLFVSSTLFQVPLASGQAPAEEDVEINVEASPRAPSSAEPLSPSAPSAADAAAPATLSAEAEALRTRLLAVEQRLAAAEAKLEEQETDLAKNRVLQQEHARNREEHARLLSRLAKLGVSISGYVQVQYGQNELSEDQLQQGGTPFNQDRFSVRRGRLRVNGRWKYVRTDFELDASTTRGPSASVRRASVSGLLPSRVEGELPYLMLTMGLTEIPLGVELQQGQDEILFLERSTGSLAFFAGPVDTGAKLEGAYGPLRLQLAIMNGAPLDDRAGGPSAIDATRAPDYVGRVGADVQPHQRLRVAGGVSLLSGTGFHGGSDASKPVLQWTDLDGDGAIGSGELVSVAGRGAIPSKTFERWAIGADLAFELTTKLGVSRLYGEILLAENLDRGLFVADPVASGVDVREFSWYAAFVQDVTQWGFVGVRYDVYDPNSDLFDARRGRVVPKDASLKTVSPIAGARWAGVGRLTFEYDFVKDKLARDHSGVPVDVSNDQWTLRLQGEF